MAEEVVNSMVWKVVDSLFGVIKMEIGYMWNCKENVEKFKDEVERLKVMMRQVQEQIDAAKDNGDNLVSGVEEWLNKAGHEISKAEEFLEQEANAKKTCFKIGTCGNWATLHRYGKITATKMTPSLSQHQVSGKSYETGVSVRTRAPGPLDVFQTMYSEDLVTHKSALNDIIAALEDESKQIIGIYGLGGSGKTTLAMEVADRVIKTNLLFDGVAFTTVSEKANVEKIKNDLESARKRIKKGETILIILDDVWEILNLEQLCIPCGSKYKNCKILLTSRRRDVCNKMNAQSISVVSLPPEEAWILFKRVVGERVETDADLKPVAQEVAKECGGLPLFIQGVGNALKDESIDSWKAALSRLKKPAASEIMDEEIERAFARLQLSYEYLKSKEAKSCFLLCSMFPPDYNISLEALVYYMVGLHELESMEDARNRVRNAVNMLTSSCLLLNSQCGEGYTKMHDVVRDVALLIASQGNNKFLVKTGQGLTEWLPRGSRLERYTGISLMHNDIIKLPDYEVSVPHLEIFLVSRNRDLSMFSDEFIGCMKKVRVLDISWNNISSLPQSFQLLTKLCTLDLRGNKSLHEISILGELKDLEILILNGTGITEIPKEIAQLVNLRVIEVKDCVDLSRITQGVILALWRLEELCIEFKLKFKGASDCIVEVMSLSNLTYLDLTVPSIDDIPAQGQGFNSKNLNGFVIHIGDFYPGNELWRSGCYLVFSRVPLGNSLAKWLKKLIEGHRPNTTLYGIENLNKIMPTLYHQGFNKLEHIQLNDCPNVSCLVDDSTIRCDGDEGKAEEKYFMELKTLRLVDLDNLEVLWKCPDEYISFTNLVTLYIYGCNKLERVFIAQGLLNLKRLDIKGCGGLEEVIWGGGGGGGDDESRNDIVFPSLATITLYKLPRLKRFFSLAGNCSIEYPSLVEVEINDCGVMEIWGDGVHKTPKLKTLVVNGDMPTVVDGPNAINEAVEKSWRKFQVGVLGVIMTALEEERTQIIGIYGLGGVGKTTLAMEVVARVKDTNLFADVAFTTVSQIVNVLKIKLDLEIAIKRIIKGDKILIILDDVWERLNLEEMCIPCGNNYMNCKILLTSRSEIVCQKMNAQRKICVNSLPTEEAWILFKRVVGERVETDPDLKPVAKEIAKECGGLPILIQAIGNALKHKSIGLWNRALTQLQKHAPLEIDEDIRKSFTHLQLSYEYLESEIAKSCFLLCSMFSEDDDISLEDLVYYMVGLHKFDDLESIEDARYKVQNAVNMLTSSCLLLNTQLEGYTKMHDVVRDVALLIASQGNNKFLVKAGKGLTEWLPTHNSLERYTGISIMHNNVIKLPDYKVNVPHLEIFLACGNRDLSMISDEFIGCMKKVLVLDISWNNISSLPQSFQLLTKLRTLVLRGNRSLHEISILGELRDLEILILDKTGITEIPKEVAQLVNLRMLQVKGCKDLSRIAQGVISALWRLEELCIDLSRMSEGVIDSTAEVMKLLKLTYLDLKVKSFDLIPKGGINTENLKGFVIQIGEYNRFALTITRSDRYLIISREHLVIPSLKWLKKLIEGSRPITILNGIENLDNIMPTLYDEGFNKFEHIQLKDCPNVSCLVDDGARCDGDEGKPVEKFFQELRHLELVDLDNLEVLWKCPDKYISLTNLVTIFIGSCDKLERVFTVRVAQGLVNLKELKIHYCYVLEEVIWGGDGGDDESANIIVFPCLAKISLWNLTRLKRFYSGGRENCSIIYRSLVDVEIGDCGSMEIWGHGIHKTPNLKTLVVNNDMQVLYGSSAINDAVEKARRKKGNKFRHQFKFGVDLVTELRTGFWKYHNPKNFFSKL